MLKSNVQELFKKVNEDHVFAMLSYLSVLCVIPLFLKKESEFVVSHAKQGVALFLCEFAVFIISIIFPVVMRPSLFIFGVLAFIGMVKALRGNKVKLPFIYAISNKLAL